MSVTVTPRGRISARIGAIATHVPSTVLDNDQLAAVFSDWTAEKILQKTGIRERRIAAEGETAVDLGVAAATRLFAEYPGLDQEIDFLIFCTQAPDYILPTSACIIQTRLGLRSGIGAIDVNLGCSGFVYGISIAAGMIAAHAARKVLLITADTYSKYIHPLDKSVRTLFGDGAAATIVEAVTDDTGGSLGPFVFGTDGRGAGSLIVEAGGFRTPCDAQTGVEQRDRTGNVRSRENLYMDGGAVLNFTLREVPAAFKTLMAADEAGAGDYDHVVLHQANKFMLDSLQKKLGVPDERMPRYYEDVGNTVSSTIPFVLAKLRNEGQLGSGCRIAMIGFGVGLSWASAAATF